MNSITCMNATSRLFGLSIKGVVLQYHNIAKFPYATTVHKWDEAIWFLRL